MENMWESFFWGRNVSSEIGKMKIGDPLLEGLMKRSSLSPSQHIKMHGRERDKRENDLFIDA